MIHPRLRAQLDQGGERVAHDVRRYGVHIQYVTGDHSARRASFAYTVGLFGVGHAELLVFSVDPSTAHGLLNEVAGWIRDGRNLVPGELLEFDHWAHRVTVETVPNPGEIVLSANRFAQRPHEASVPVLQLTYDDLGGLFPWQAGYRNASWLQPRPGTFRA